MLVIIWLIQKEQKEMQNLFLFLTTKMKKYL